MRCCQASKQIENNFI